MTSPQRPAASSPQNFSHPVKAPAVSIVYEQGRSGDRAVLHAKGCSHARARYSRGTEYIVGIVDFDLTRVLADDYFDVAPCARKAA